MNRDVFITENEFAAFSDGTNWNRVCFFFLVWVVAKSSPLALLRYLETAPINFVKAFPWYQLCQSPANQSPTDTLQGSAFASGTGLLTHL